MENLKIDIVPTLHTHPTPSLNPALIKLRYGFTVLIIGASRGIGAHIAQAYAQAKVRTLILAARTTTDLYQLARLCQRISPGTSVLCEHCDIASSESVAEMADSISRRTESRLDVVINNSGYAGPTVTSFTGGTADDFHRCFQVNTFGLYHVARHLVPLLLKTKGGAKSLVVVSGAAAWITEGPIANIAYCSSRLAQLRLVEMMARQYEKDGLLSVAVHPGAVATETAMAGPQEFIPFLVDSVDLCGAFCVWLTRDSQSMMWLSGRYLSSKWDVDELLEKKAEIIDGDLLKASMKI
ncbi:MAG: hypothetical protein Q9200_001625 [Gallowayella weberi]